MLLHFELFLSGLEEQNNRSYPNFDLCSRCCRRSHIFLCNAQLFDVFAVTGGSHLLLLTT